MDSGLGFALLGGLALVVAIVAARYAARLLLRAGEVLPLDREERRGRGGR